MNLFAHLTIQRSLLYDPLDKRKATKWPPLTFASIITSIVCHLAIKYLNSKYKSNLRTKLGRFEYLFNTIFVPFPSQDFHGSWFWRDRETLLDVHSLLKKVIYMIIKWPVQNNFIGSKQKYWVKVLKSGAGFASAKIISKRSPLNTFSLRKWQMKSQRIYL